MIVLDVGRVEFSPAMGYVGCRSKQKEKGGKFRRLTSGFNAYESVFDNVDSATAVSAADCICGCEDVYGVCDCFGFSVFGVFELAGYAFGEMDCEEFFLIRGVFWVDGQFPHV